MVFQPRALSRFATSVRERGARTNVYAYTTRDSLGDLLSTGYFDGARRRFGLAPGDIIDCSTDMLDVPRAASLQVVSTTLSTVAVEDVTLLAGGLPAGALILRGKPLSLKNSILTLGARNA